MHDWWLAMVAAAKGELVELPDATILYRQHSSNTLGAVKWSLWSALGNALTNPNASLKRIRTSIRNTQRQAFAFYTHFGQQLDQEVGSLVRGYGTLDQQSAWQRKMFFVRKSLWTRSPLMNAGLLAVI